MRTIISTTILLFSVGLSASFAQVGIGTTTPDTSAILDLESTNKGVLVPRMNTTQRDAIIGPSEGLVIFNTTVNSLQWWNGTRWFDVFTGSIATLDCSSATNIGTLISGASSSGVYAVVPYTVSNGRMHHGETVNSTGVTGLTATLNAGTFASGNGALTYTITGTPSGAGTANFALNIGGQNCTLSRTVGAGAIASLSCGTATNNGTLTVGYDASGVNSVVPYTGGNGGPQSGQTVNSTGVTGLTATLNAGTFASGNGFLTYLITRTPSAVGTANFALNIGGQNCTLSRTVVIGPIASLSCGTATNNGTLTAGVSFSGVNSVVPYTGGNGSTHNGQSVNSTGVTGLTATLGAGTFVFGNGSLTYTISGTPSGAGTANFALNIAGQNCTLSRTVTAYPAGYVHCNPANPTAIVDVVSITGKTWMDRNLGAGRAAISRIDSQSYGSLFQWGRFADGHQCVARYSGDGVTTSGTIFTLATSTVPNGGNSWDGLFIRNFANWLTTSDNNLWQDINGINNPCKFGYRLPTASEWDNENLTWSPFNRDGAFTSLLKLSSAGTRSSTTGNLSEVNNFSIFHSSTVSGLDIVLNHAFEFTVGNLNIEHRSGGRSVRCIKD